MLSLLEISDAIDSLIQALVLNIHYYLYDNQDNSCQNLNLNVV